MLLQNLRAKVGARLKGDKEAGFTLIELLVVMLILGILAAIALPAFFNQRDKAGDSKAKENAHSAQVAMETYATEHGGNYTGATVAELKLIEPTIKASAKEGPSGSEKDSEGIIVASASGKNYTLNSVSSTGNVFTIKNTGGTMAFECTKAGSGGCPAAPSGSPENSPGDWSK